jgi:hypothetical protein
LHNHIARGIGFDDVERSVGRSGKRGRFRSSQINECRDCKLISARDAAISV